MNNKLNKLLLTNELNFLKDQKQKQQDFQMSIDKVCKVDVGLIEAYELDNVNISKVERLMGLIENIEKKIANCDLIEKSTSGINDLPF